MDARKILSLLVVAAMIAVSGCATDDAAKKDAEKAQPTVEKAADDAGNAAEDAADEVDDNDSK